MVLTKCIESTRGINSTFRHVIVTQLIMSLAFLTNAELTLPKKNISEINNSPIFDAMVMLKDRYHSGGPAHREEMIF